MVYRGKPSKACHACRGRRLRCDQNPGGCGNCGRAAIACPGYQNQTDALFVHETDQVITKQQQRENAPQPQPPLDEPLADIALAYFYNVHVLHVDAPNDFSCPSVGEGCLLASMQALGLAAFASVTKQPDKMVAAREYYGAAIAKVNLALRSSVDVKRDSTLLAVVILTYFETITGSDTVSLDAWSNHIAGTAALIEKRGAQQMQSAEGRCLFLVSTTNMISNCLRLAIRIPQCIHEIWQAGVTQYADPEDPLWQIHSAWFELVDFHNDVENKRISTKSIIPEALRVDWKLSQALKRPSGAWTFRTGSAPSKLRRKGLPEYVHYYNNSLSTQIWNSMRSGRLILHATILKFLLTFSTTALGITEVQKSDQLCKSTMLMSNMKTEVLASVPQCLGMLHKEDGRDTEPPESENISMSGAFLPTTPIPTPPAAVSRLLTLRSDRLPVLHTSRGYNLVWTLALIGKLISRTDESRPAICDYIRLAGSRLGMQQAFKLASIVENGEDR